jgi:hypothetical protein
MFFFWSISARIKYPERIRLLHVFWQKVLGIVRLYVIYYILVYFERIYIAILYKTVFLGCKLTGRPLKKTTKVKIKKPDSYKQR